MNVCQLVCYTIGLEVLPLAEDLGIWWNDTHDIRTSGRPTVSADDDPILELDGHNRCLDNAPIPHKYLHLRYDIWETYTEVNLARLESSDIDRESFHCYKMKTVAESMRERAGYYASSRVPISLDRIPSLLAHTRPPRPSSFLDFQHGDPPDGSSLP